MDLVHPKTHYLQQIFVLYVYLRIKTIFYENI
jgi:hypothetical protein